MQLKRILVALGLAVLAATTPLRDGSGSSDVAGGSGSVVDGDTSSTPATSKSDKQTDISNDNTQSPSSPSIETGDQTDGSSAVATESGNQTDTSSGSSMQGGSTSTIGQTGTSDGAKKLHHGGKKNGTAAAGGHEGHNSSTRPKEIKMGLKSKSHRKGDQDPIEVLYWPKGDRTCKAQTLSGVTIQGTKACHDLHHPSLSFHIGGPLGDEQIQAGYTLVGYAQKGCKGKVVLTLPGRSSSKMCYAIGKHLPGAQSLKLMASA